MSCFWTDLVAATQFCEPEPGGTGVLGSAIEYFDDFFNYYYAITVDTDGAPAAFAAAMAALIGPPAPEINNALHDPVASPFYVKRENPALAGFIVSPTAACAGISVYETGTKTVDTDVYINPSEVYDPGAGIYSVAFDDTIESGSLTVSEAYLAYLQVSGSDTTFHGIAVAELPVERFTAGIPVAGTLRIDYAGGSEPALGEFTLYGSADAGAPNIVSTSRIVTIVRVVGSVVTGASGSIAVDCYITGYRNGEV